jgi:exopolyphosphatase/guanosine-5'-triphosphate,3'-diphosphate pyrophosphatase
LNDPVAAIDCGTNSTRLLISGPDGTPLIRLMRITRLGEGVDAGRALLPGAMARTVAVLQAYRAEIDRFGATRIRMTATSAARDATNRDQFFAAAAAAVGVVPELLPGEEEGRLSFLGATAELGPSGGPWLVADIGGGSTELVVGPGPDGGPAAVRSLDVGCVRMSERWLTQDPPRPEEVAAARAHVGALLDDVSRAEAAYGRARMLVGLAGTVAALARLDQGLVEYDRDRLHHYTLSREAVEGQLASLAGQPAASRRLVPGMEPERADVIVGGTIVLAELMGHFGFEACLTSEADILDGLTRSLLSA